MEQISIRPSITVPVHASTHAPRKGMGRSNIGKQTRRSPGWATQTLKPCCLDPNRLQSRWREIENGKRSQVLSSSHQRMGAHPTVCARSAAFSSSSNAATMADNDKPVERACSVISISHHPPRAHVTINKIPPRTTSRLGTGEQRFKLVYPMYEMLVLRLTAVVPLTAGA